MSNSTIMDDLFILSELSNENALGEESFEGFLTRLFNWDPVRLRSSWKRLGKVSRKYTPAMGSKTDVELVSDSDDYTMNLVSRGNQIVKDLAKEVLFDIHLVLESDKILTDNVEALQIAINNGTLGTFVPKDLAIFNRPLLGARSITGTENELDLIKQGNEPEMKTKFGYGVGHNGRNVTHNITVDQYYDRTKDIRKLDRAGTYWDNRMTNDVVKGLRLLKPIADRSNLISKNMVYGGGSLAKKHIKTLMVWQEILYEHVYFLVHRTSRFLTESN